MTDETKLPKWAQDRLFTLRQELARARRALDSQTWTRVYQRDIRMAGSEDMFRYLDETLPVSFQYNPQNQFARIDVHMRADGSLKVYGTDGALVINPEASNVITLRSTRF